MKINNIFAVRIDPLSIHTIKPNFMQKISKLMIGFFLLTAFTLAGDFGKDIIGKWKVDDASVPTARKNMIERVRKMSPDQATQMEAYGEQLDMLIKSITFEYKTDGTLEVATPQGPQSIKWSISADNKYLVKVGPDGSENKDSIIDIKKDKVTLFDLSTKTKVDYVPAQ